MFVDRNTQSCNFTFGHLSGHEKPDQNHEIRVRAGVCSAERRKQNASSSNKESELSLSVGCSGEPAASGACLGSGRSPRGSAPHPGASRTSLPSAGRASLSGMFLLPLNASVSHRIYF